MIKMKRFQKFSKRCNLTTGINSIRSASLLFRLFITLLVLGVCISSCENSEGINIPNIEPLTILNTEPQQHYKLLGNLSTIRSTDRSALDDIKFPKKAHALTIKTISPAYLNREEIVAQINNFQPPSNSSEQTRAELDFLLDLQEKRTDHQVAEALRMHDIVYFPIIGMKNDDHLFFELTEIYGDGINVNNYPKTKKLMGNIMKEMRITEFTAKNKFLRARPRQLETKLTPLKKMSSSSYASGHTLWAYMQAYLFGELIPEKRSEFLELAFDIGFSREVLGVHYPSDEEASRVLAHQLLSKMWKKEGFKRDFESAKAEWQVEK